MVSSATVYYFAVPLLWLMPSFHPTTYPPIDTQIEQNVSHHRRETCLPNLRVSLRRCPQIYGPNSPSASANEQPQSQVADQATAPITTSSAPADAIQQVSRTTTASTQVAKDNAAVTVDSADPLDLGKHRRSNVTQAQMKADYPQANKKRMKVCDIRHAKGPPLTNIEILHKAEPAHRSVPPEW